MTNSWEESFMILWISHNGILCLWIDQKKHSFYLITKNHGANRHAYSSCIYGFLCYVELMWNGWIEILYSFQCKWTKKCCFTECHYRIGEHFSLCFWWMLLCKWYKLHCVFVLYDYIQISFFVQYRIVPVRTLYLFGKKTISSLSDLAGNKLDWNKNQGCYC